MRRKILDKLETLNEEYLILNEEEMRYVRKGVKSRDWDVRDVVAEILVGWYTPENEQILYNLTFDKEEMVCVDAVDSLCIGRTRRSLNRLRELMQDKRTLVRGYAVQSFFDVWVNCFSWNHRSMKAYLRFVEEMEKKEKSKWVKTCYDRNRVLAQDRRRLEHLFYILEHGTEVNRYVSSCAVGVIGELRNINNQNYIDGRLEKVVGNFQGYGLEREIQKIMEKQEKARVLLLDNTNSGVTQLLEYVGNEETNMEFRSAGLHPAGKIENWVLELLEEAGDITRWQYSSPVEQLCWYDYIVPFGITLDAKDYPFQKVYQGYQDNREKRMDLERACSIVKEIERNCSYRGQERCEEDMP